MSPIDKIFNEIFGHLPNKAGTAYEMFSCIAEHLMSEGNILHDNKIRGEFSKTLYQIDVHSSSPDGIVMGEAKDYTIQNSKVGRADLQKLAGALPDLPEVTKGKFFSATGYTSPAKKYAQAASNFSGQKPIEIFELRPSTEKDEEGTIKTIVVKIHVVKPQAQLGIWKPHFTTEGLAAIKNTAISKDYGLTLEKFYNSNGDQSLTLFELTSTGYAETHSDTKCAHGTYLLKHHYIIVNGIFAELKGLEYEVPFSEYFSTVEITDDRKCRFILKDESGDIVRFITDDQLQNYRFDSDGRLIAPPAQA
ncbi:Restriction endonuclease [Pseudomonas sp. NFACC24-1]|uniref:restriction endonuclease n=1 Tax=Pseudomonas sp. NFACC24-1 TaxID=1566189 RepID=UPI0008E3EAE8|nr:restriction endonuclease [Pseudomonas sp. NFACC24-1]SFN51141.1 Restriction endonuclease [Pseudomonas sp. NFACC24-1]